MKKEFTKSDLKNGMVVEYKNGERRLVLKECLTGIEGRNSLIRYNEDLTFRKCQNYNIEKIYNIINITSLGNLFNDNNLTLIWERNPRKKMTKEEIEAELEYKIEIVEE